MAGLGGTLEKGAERPLQRHWIFHAPIGRRPLPALAEIAPAVAIEYAARGLLKPVPLRALLHSLHQRIRTGERLRPRVGFGAVASPLRSSAVLAPPMVLCCMDRSRPEVMRADYIVRARFTGGRSRVHARRSFPVAGDYAS